MRWMLLLMTILAGPARSDEVGDALRFVMVNGGYVQVPLARLATGHLVAEVEINGQRGLFLVDSGASRTVLDQTRAALYPLGPVISQQPITGMVGAQTVEGRGVAAYRVGDVTGGDAVVFVADLRFVTEAIADLGGPVVDGILGQDWLTTHGAILDMRGNRLFLKP